MMKINTLYYKELRNEEFLGLHKNFVELTANITAEEILSPIEAYRTAVTAFALTKVLQALLPASTRNATLHTPPARTS